MKIRFQADADLKSAIVSGVLRREPAIDFQLGRAAGLVGREDQEVLLYCAAHDRILVSHDVSSMPEAFGKSWPHALLSWRTAGMRDKRRK